MKQRIWKAVVVGGLGFIMLSGCIHAPPFVSDDIPESLSVAVGQSVVARAHAVGVQIYQCKAAKDDASRFEYSLSAPDAVLTNKSGKQIARHYAGPTWEATDGSKVVGEVISRAASPRDDSIPWLLLRAKLTSGAGLFSPVNFIQRVHTMGGNPPPSCNAAQSGEEIRVSYSADYYFFSGPGS